MSWRLANRTPSPPLTRNIFKAAVSVTFEDLDLLLFCFGFSFAFRHRIDAGSEQLLRSVVKLARVFWTDDWVLTKRNVLLGAIELLAPKPKLRACRQDEQTESASVEHLVLLNLRLRVFDLFDR